MLGFLFAGPFYLRQCSALVGLCILLAFCFGFASVFSFWRSRGGRMCLCVFGFTFLGSLFWPFLPPSVLSLGFAFCLLFVLGAGLSLHQLFHLGGGNLFLCFRVYLPGFLFLYLSTSLRALVGPCILVGPGGGNGGLSLLEPSTSGGADHAR